MPKKSRNESPKCDETEFGRLVGGATETKSAFFGCTLPTLRRWIDGDVEPPVAALRLARLAFGGDLSGVFGRAWSEVELTAPGLRLPGWRNPIPVGELRALFWRGQQVATLERSVEQLRKDLARETAARIAAEERAEYFRRMVGLEARLGLALARIAG